MPLRGYNESGKPDGIDAYQMETLVTDIKCLVKELGVEKFTLVRFTTHPPTSKILGMSFTFLTSFAIYQEALNLVAGST